MLDPNKPVVLVDGVRERPARIIATDRKGRYPLAALVDVVDQELIYCFNSNGTTSNDNFYLKNTSVKTSKWRNVWTNSAYSCFDYNTLRQAAESGHGQDRLGFLELKYVDGVFVDAVFHKNEETS